MQAHLKTTNTAVKEAKNVTLPTIAKGDKGLAVKIAQKILILNGYLSSASYDAIFNPKTEQAVRNYQRRHGLPVDGVVGVETWEQLIKDITSN